MPRTMTSTPNAIRSHKFPRLAGATGVVATGLGVLAGSEDVVAVATGIGASAAGVLTGSGGVLAVTAGFAVAAAGVAGRLCGGAGSRIG